LGEVIRSVTRRTPGQHLLERLAEPVGLAMWIGLANFGDQMGGYGDARARALTEALGTVLRG
jgi:hypothetical protein